MTKRVRGNRDKFDCWDHKKTLIAITLRCGKNTMEKQVRNSRGMKEGESIRQRDKKACNECSPAANPPINQLSGPFPITSLSGAWERDHSETTVAVKDGGIAMTLLPINSAQANQT